jgi:sialate O-acetylesterase
MGMARPGIALATVIAASAAPLARGAVQTNALFSDGMVLQTAADAPLSKPTTLYGSATPGETVRLEAEPAIPGSPYSVKASSDGSWSIQLKPDVAPGSLTALDGRFSLTLSGDSGPAITAKDVVWGDVYLCTGQSNMEKTVSYTFNATAEIAAAKHPNMRLFQRQTISCRNGAPPPPGVARSECGPNGEWSQPSRELSGSCIYDGSPGKACTNPKRTWTAVTPEVIGKFSAICYFTVRDVARGKTGSRAQGLIESDWGGTPVQAWTKPEGLQACGMSTTNCTTEPHGNCSHYPSKLFNHMVYPFVGYGLRAILWYQVRSLRYIHSSAAARPYCEAANYDACHTSDPFSG